MTVRISPSILSADFANFDSELQRVAAADLIHVDVMDNHFVPNLTFGPAMVEALARSTSLPIDAHLMITDADRHAPAYVEAGAGSVTFHVEAAAAPVRLGPAGEQAARLEPRQRRIDGARAVAEHAQRRGLEQKANVVARAILPEEEQEGGEGVQVHPSRMIRDVL